MPSSEASAARKDRGCGAQISVPNPTEQVAEICRQAQESFLPERLRPPHSELDPSGQSQEGRGTSPWAERRESWWRAGIPADRNVGAASAPRVVHIAKEAGQNQREECRSPRVDGLPWWPDYRLLSAPAVTHFRTSTESRPGVPKISALAPCLCSRTCRMISW